MYCPAMKNYLVVTHISKLMLLWSAVYLLTTATAHGQGQTGGSPPGGGQNAGGQQQGQSSTAGAGATYRIQSDMLAYQASDVIAQRIAADVQNQRLVIYDGPTFENLQFYEAYTAALSAFESAYNQLSPGGGSSLQDYSAVATAAQTIVNTLAAVRSSTEYGTQQTSLQSDALVSELAHHLSASSTVIAPKLFLETPNDLNFSAAPPANNCSSVVNSVPDQLACILKIRGQKVNAKGFADLDKIFQSFFANLIGVTVATSLAAQSSGGGGGGGGTQPSPAAPSVPSPSNAPQLNSIPLLATIIQGHRLATQLQTPACGAGAGSTKLLVLEATAAGGSYRVRHNFWVEVFWTTPSPSYNGGAVVTYLLIDPCSSAVIQSDTLRYMYDYGKFEHSKKLKSRANFTPINEAE
jgi:hypothetical protein